MRLNRKLWFRTLKRLKWELGVLCLLFMVVNSLYQKSLYFSTKISSLCEPIDVVYTWINGSDSEFLKTVRNYDPNFDPARFDDKNELKYSLRSLEKFAPWVRHIYIVTNGQIPKWLDLTNDRITVVPHEVLVSDTEILPTFSSAAIETFINKIPDLSDRFIYFNDDVFLGSYLYPEDLYTDSEGVRIYQAWLVPDCAEDCPWSYIGDGSCDRHCCIESCQYDGGDCAEELSHNNNANYVAQSIINKIRISKFHKKFTQKKQMLYKNNLNASSFQNVLLWQKNLSSLKDYKNIVNDFNKNIQSKYFVNKLDSSLHFNSFETNLNFKPKDIYSESLKYTNRFLNRQYGFKARNVIAHVGFLIEKPIMDAMQKKFAKEIAVTARNRFRSPNDLQFALTYYSFIIEETSSASVAEIFDEFDTDHSITWSDREIRTFLSKVFPLPLDWSAVKFFEEVINNCSILQKPEMYNNIQYTTPIYERYEDSNLPTITRDFVEQCSPLANALKDNFAFRRRYKYQINPKHSLRNNFMMLTSNITEVVNDLDKMRKNLRKFNCVNDNLDANSTKNNELIRQLLEDFYLSLFPKRSQFELLPQYRNRFQNWRDYIRWQAKQKTILIAIYFISILILAYLIHSICIYKAKFVNSCVQKL